jgi:hypothetical protein
MVRGKSKVAMLGRRVTNLGKGWSITPVALRRRKIAFFRETKHRIAMYREVEK